MVEIEFREWLREYCVAFPQTQAWIDGLTDSTATLAAWRGAMSDVDPDAAAEVTRRMAAGDIEPPAAYDREKTAAIVRRHAREIVWRRADASRRAEPAEADTGARHKPLGPVLRRAMQIGQQFRDGQISASQRAEAMEQVRRDAVDPTAPEPRYPCPICRGVGSVTVWHPRSIEAAKSTGRPPARRLTCAVACTCVSGRVLAEGVQAASGKPGYRALPTYDEARDCICRHSTPSKDDEESMMEWLHGSADAGRHAEFDDWNAGAPV